MGQTARNPGGTGGRGYPGNPLGLPDRVMWASVQKCYKREPQGGESGVGIEVVTEKEFVQRKWAAEKRPTPADPYTWGMTIFFL